MSLLDIIFPKRCVGCKKSGEYLCSNCFSEISFDIETMCTVCNKPCIDGRTHPACRTRYTLDGTFSAVVYKKVVRKLIYQLKYNPYLTDLLPLLADISYESLIENELFANILATRPLLVPIPLSARRQRKRGYNQAELLAKALGKRFGLDVMVLLKRARDTKPQYGLKREERIDNMKDAFVINPKLKIENGKLKIVVLIDDVLTTGSTMSEAAKILKKAGAKEVWGLAFAKD